MARPMSCSTGLRSLPFERRRDRGAGTGFDVNRMKSRKAPAIQPCTASTSAFSRVRQVGAEGGDQRAEQREDQHPEEHRALVVPPHAGDLVEQRLCRMRVLDDVDAARSRRRCRRWISAAKATPDEQELRQRRRPGHRHPAARSPRHRAGERQRSTATSASTSARTRAKWPSSAIIARPTVRRRAPASSPSSIRPCAFSASTTSRGMYFSSCLASTESAVNTPSGADQPFGHNALPFAEQVGKDALVGDRRRWPPPSVTAKRDASVLALDDAALRHQAAEAEAAFRAETGWRRSRSAN